MCLYVTYRDAIDSDSNDSEASLAVVPAALGDSYATSLDAFVGQADLVDPVSGDVLDFALNEAAIVVPDEEEVDLVAVGQHLNDDQVVG